MQDAKKKELSGENIATKTLRHEGKMEIWKYGNNETQKRETLNM